MSSSFSHTASSRRWGVSTMGEPGATLDDWMTLCQTWGIAEIELRTLAGSLDLGKVFAETFGTPAAFADALRNRPAKIAVLSLSLRLAVENPAHREELVALMPWAEAAGIPHIRAFDKTGPHLPWTDDEWRIAADQFRWWRQQRRQHGWQAELIIEGHNAFYRPSAYQRFCEQVGEAPPLIFDIGHAVRGLGADEALAAWETLAPHAPRVHFKDVAAPNAAGLKHCLPGAGIVPLDAFMKTFDAMQAPPVLTVEWERQWEPRLPPLTEALDHLRQNHWL